MATIGDALLSPENGWIRVNDNHVNFTYENGSSAWTTGSGIAGYYNSDFHNYSGSATNKGQIKFNFTGTKIRIICRAATTLPINNTITVNKDSYTFSTYRSVNQSQTLVFELLSLDDKEHSVIIKNGDGAIIFDAVDIESGKSISPYSPVHYKRFLILNNNEKYYYSSGWISLGVGVPTEQDYLNYGMEDVSTLPESAWSQLTGEVELCYYTDDPNKTEVSFNIETIPFTLAEEWENKQIKIVEYTDDPNQTESIVSIETEPFTLYDELEDNMEVLYYTDDPTKSFAQLDITANYSPLDELEGDFDVVTWSDNNTTKSATTSSIPSPQSIIQTDDYYMYGDLLSIVDKLNSTNGTLRYAVSFNEGSTWEVCKFGKWRNINISTLSLFKSNGMSKYDISLIDAAALKNKGTKIRFAYYIEDNIHNSNPGIEIDNMKLNINSATETIKIDNVAFYVLNTNATIQLSLTGSKLTGILDDSDKGRVQYRVLLNDKPYYPSDGTFTRLAPSPQDIDINISDREIIFNQPNKLKVEFQDYWGETDYWETTFIGTYSGLMFMDDSGEYLSDTFGGILKQLDFGVIIAGQTTFTQKVRIKNQLGYAIDNVYLEMDKKYERDGVVVELSRQENPFLATDYLTFGLTQPDDVIDFYVRIATDMRAKPNPNGIFELKVNADRV
ncbi:hypothetical protein [Paenibacillus xylanexedens]|uniref:hypothetical protein n=1 Tax=Paenibacillus xylanexedens TaxID=528191 RepID=UPI0011A4441D|nr:hypothetical protein [Paenibacillus xylanexedens]